MLRIDVTPQLLAADHPAVVYFARRDLLGDAAAGPVEQLWDCAQAVRILGRQQGDGRWRYSGGDRRIRSADNYDQLETLRQLGVLVHKFGLTRGHPAVERAAAFLRTFQTDAGDYRGIYGNQYTPNYSAAITEVLTSAGLGRTRQVTDALAWLRAARQDDGGWAIPTRTRCLPLTAMLTRHAVIEPDRSKPSSHLVTGIVLRAFAAHPAQRRSPVARQASALLASRFFQRDVYPDHAAASYWSVFSYPFWWTDLLSALDSLTRIGFGPQDPDLARGLEWFVENQEPNGLWNTGRNRPKDRYSDLWVALAVGRVLMRCRAD